MKNSEDHTEGQPQVGTTVLFALAVVLALCGCDAQPSAEVKVATSERIVMGGSATNGMEIKVVVLDGNEYYATKTHAGYWTLCPKLPPK